MYMFSENRCGCDLEEPYAGNPHVRFCGGGHVVTHAFTRHFRKKGLKKVINEICQHKVNKIILTHRDRLVRFGFPLFQQICKFFNVQIQVLFEDKEKTFEQELVADVIEIMTVCTARIYGKRSHKHAKAG